MDTRTVTFPSMDGEEVVTVEVPEQVTQMFPGPVPDEGPVHLEAPMTEDILLLIHEWPRLDIFMERARDSEFARKLTPHKFYLRLWGLLWYFNNGRKAQDILNLHPRFKDSIWTPFKELADQDPETFILDIDANDVDPRESFMQAVLLHNDMEFKPGDWRSFGSITPHNIVLAERKNELMTAFQYDFTKHSNHPFSETFFGRFNEYDPYLYAKSSWKYHRRFWTMFYKCYNKEGEEVPFEWNLVITPGVSLVPVLDLDNPCILMLVLYSLPWVAFRPHRGNVVSVSFAQKMMHASVFSMEDGKDQQHFFYLYFLMYLQNRFLPGHEIRRWAEYEIERAAGYCEYPCFNLLLADRDAIQDDQTRMARDVIQNYHDKRLQRYLEEKPFHQAVRFIDPAVPGEQPRFLDTRRELCWIVPAFVVPDPRQ